MALILPAQGIADIRGSQGGTVYSRNRYGNYVRNRTIPVNPNTEKQQSVRAEFRWAANAWRDGLTDADRLSWETYASITPWTNKLGMLVYLSGQAMFMRSAIISVQAGLNLPADAPTTGGLPSVDTTLAASADISDQDVDITFDNTKDWAAAGGVMTIHQGIPHPSSIAFYGGPWIQIGQVLGNATPPTSPATKTLYWQTATGLKVPIRVRFYNPDGKLSNWQYTVASSVA